MSDRRRGLVTPYPDIDAARRGRRALWLALGAVVLGWGLLMVSLVLETLGYATTTHLTVASASIPGATSSSNVFPVVIIPLLVAAAERRKLDEAAGRKLLESERELIFSATAAGVLVPDPDLIVVQEMYARRHLSVTGAALSGAFFVAVMLVLPFMAALSGLTHPLLFVASSLLILAGGLYAVVNMVRRACGAEMVNVFFDQPLTPAEDQALADGEQKDF